MLSKCIRCAVVFNRLDTEELCPQCDDEVTQSARKVDAYLAHNPGRNAATVAAATGVPADFVERYRGGGSPEEAVRPLEADVRPCTRCGEAPASVGALCKRCAIEVRQDVRDAAAEEAESPPAASGGVVSSRRGQDDEAFRAVRYRYD